MDRTLQILLIADDPALRTEVENAFEELPDELRAVLHEESDVRRGIEHALHRAPDVVLLEAGGDFHQVRRVALEISAANDPPIVVALYPQLAIQSGENDADVLIELLRANVKDFLRRPLAASELEALLRRHFVARTRAHAERGRVVSFMGNKGGVGKSTLSLSMACRLAAVAPGRTLLVDASLQQGNMCELLDLEPTNTIADAAKQIDRLDERLLRMMSVPHESGLRVLAAPPNAIDAAPVDDVALARILSVARREFDFVVVDTFPLIDGITIAILDVADLVFVVLNDFVPAVLGTAELLTVLEKLGVEDERIRLVLNHSHAGFRGRLREEDVAERLGRAIDFKVPYSRGVPTSTNTGEPYALRASRWFGFGRALRRIEAEILSGTTPRIVAPEDAGLADELGELDSDAATVRPYDPHATESQGGALDWNGSTSGDGSERLPSPGETR